MQTLLLTRGALTLDTTTWGNSRYCFYCKNCTKFVQLILIVVTRCQILRLKCTRFDFCWGSAPDTAGGLQRSPDPLAGGEGLAAPSTITQPPLSALRASPLLSMPGSFSQILAPDKKRLKILQCSFHLMIVPPPRL